MPPDFIHQSDLTDACTVSRANLARTIVGMAHFAGTGPASRLCKDCLFWQAEAKKTICQKYRQLTGDRSKAVPPGAASCRYFEERKPS